MPLYQELLDKYNVHNKCRKYRDDAIDVSVPGEVHRHLHAAGLVQNDISYRNEHQEQAWVAFQIQRYETKFHVSKDQLVSTFSIKLDHVGAIGDVYVNNNFIGVADNLYRVFYMPIAEEYLNEGENTLRIDIDSTIKYTYYQSAKHNITDH